MVGDKIKECRKNSNMSQEKLGKYLDVSQQAVGKWEKNAAEPDSATLLKLATLFNVTVDYLLGNDKNARLPNIKNISHIGKIIKMPIIGTIAAGYDGIAVEEELGEIEILETALHGYYPEDCFILKVKGYSMYPDYIPGDLVAIHKQSSVDSGQTAVVLYDGDEATLKKVKYVQGEDWLELIPRNPEYQTKRIEGEDLNQCRVLGKVLSLVYRDLT